MIKLSNLRNQLNFINRDSGAKLGYNIYRVGNKKNPKKHIWNDVDHIGSSNQIP